MRATRRATSSTSAGASVERHVTERAGRVVARRRLDGDAGGVALDRDADGLAVEQCDADEHIGAGRVGHERDALR